MRSDSVALSLRMPRHPCREGGTGLFWCVEGVSRGGGEQDGLDQESRRDASSPGRPLVLVVAGVELGRVLPCRPPDSTREQGISAAV